MAKRIGLSVGERFKILKRDGYTCVYCGAHGRGVELQVDHVKPVALGGTNDPENLATACKDCNLGKRHHPLNDNDGETRVEQMEREARESRAAWIEGLALPYGYAELLHKFNAIADLIGCVYGDAIGETGAAALRGLQTMGVVEPDATMAASSVTYADERGVRRTSFMLRGEPANEYGGLKLSTFYQPSAFSGVAEIYG